MISPRTRKAIAFLVVGLTALILYAQKLDNEFAWDDYAFILGADEQAYIENIPRFFATDQHRLYRPIRSVAYTLVRHFWGLSAPAHNSVGVILHVAICLVFMAVVLRLSGSLQLAFLSAMLAALHPVRCDRAVFITGSFDLVGMFFAFLSLLPLMSWMEKGRRQDLFVGCLLLFVGLLGSEESATVPLLLTLFFLALPDYLEKPRRFAWLFVSSMAFVVLYIVLRAIYVPGFSRVATYQAGGLYETLLTMSVVFWRYIAYTLWPFGLTAEHEVTIYSNLSFLPFVALLGLVALAISAFALRKKAPFYFIGIGWFFIGLAPFSNLVPLQTLLAERYFYSGILGVLLIVAMGLNRLVNAFNGWKNKSVWVMIGFLFFGLFVLATQRINVWQSEYALWGDAMKKAPNTYMATLNWGNVLREKFGDKEQAWKFTQRAMEIDPNGHVVHVAFGNHYMETGEYDKAKKHYLRALELREGHLPAIEGLMQVELKLDEFQEAFKRALGVLEYQPNHLVSLNVVSYILIRTNHCERAIAYLERLIKHAGTNDLKEAAQKNLNFCRGKISEETE